MKRELEQEEVSQEFNRQPKEQEPKNKKKGKELRVKKDKRISRVSQLAYRRKEKRGKK